MSAPKFNLTPIVFMALLDTPGFLVDFDRLRGTNLACRGTKIAIGIDWATGRMDAEVLMLRDFAEELAERLVPGVLHELAKETGR